ncbi:MAG: hypothetical protein DI537_36060 [Stutzerimonas stutzeri]|nr:MAG: hypothetical protein DI537_36060 [Stutzerimonas stutzeri]
MSYTKAADVRAPKGHWSLIEVLVDHGESTEALGKWSLAVGEWDGERRLAARWNGTSEREAGNPQSRGIATWFVMPPEFADHLMPLVPAEKLSLAKALLNLR